jgi:GDP-4-dehydro-6-deoxy-D-mannose reductase
MKALITGITGFVGSHLAEFLLAEGVQVFGTIRWRSQTENIDHLAGKITLLDCDIRDGVSMRHVLDEVRPDHIYHLAAQSYVPMSWRAPAETLGTNIQGQVNLLESLRNLGINPMVQIACSSEEYGMVYPNEVPITEDNPLRPLSPYGVSKVGQDLLAYQYFMSYGMNVVRTRAFNHTGPRRGPVFVTSNFARQIAEIEKGRQEPVVRVGNLEAIRDFTDVRDIVRGYYVALMKGRPGEVYNLCSGKPHSIQDVLDGLLAQTKLEVKVEQEESRMRPSDVPILHGDNTKFREETGWEPQIPFEQTMVDLLDYWRRH